MTSPLTEQQLDDIETRAAHLHEYATLTDVPLQADADQLTGEDVPALLAEVHRLRAVLEQIRHLHKDSPMGPCPVCIDADAAAAGGDGLVPYPCPTGRLAGAQDCDPPHVRAAAAGEQPAVGAQPTDPREPFRFVDDDGDYLHIGIPATPANGGPAISFHTVTEPVHLPVGRVDEVIAALHRLKAAQQ